MAKCSSTGEGLYSSGGSSGSADAAIDIHSDSPTAAYKGPSTAVPRTGQQGHHFMGVMHNVAADAHGERDVGPRLPYV